MTSPNDLALVSTVVGTLRAAGADVWVFGGWAEELRGLRACGPHGDIDLLLRGPGFPRLDAIASDLPGVTGIPAKRFSHKRAFEWAGVRVEVLLVEPGALETVLFDGQARLRWPRDTFAEGWVGGLPIASGAALRTYRRDHGLVSRAYAANV